MEEKKLGIIELVERLLKILEQEGDLPVHVYEFGVTTQATHLDVVPESESGCPRRLEIW